MAARIIEPSKGASTWAFGSHKWVKNIGIFTRNATINSKGIFNMFNIINDEMKDWLLLSKIILASKGREAVIVYNIK